MDTAQHLPVVIIACQVLQDLLIAALPEALAGRVIWKDYGLHIEPRKMTAALQTEIDRIEEPSLVVLGYGLCGNGLRGIRSGKHTLLLPRVADCISLLLGSYEAYTEQSRKEPGTYYLSKGWLEVGSDPLREYETYVAKYGEETALWLMDQQYRHYRRLILVAHNQSDLEQYRQRAQEVARFCGRWDMQYEERLGSDAYVRQLAGLIPQVAAGAPLGMAHLAELVDGDFLVLPPGEEIRQESFVR